MTKQDKEKRSCDSDSREGERLLRRLHKSADDYILWYEVQRLEKIYAEQDKGRDQH